MKKVISFAVAGLAISSAAAWYGWLEYKGAQYNSAAIQFWGRDYTPDGPTLASRLGFSQRELTPQGGPLILSQAVLAACPSTELMYVPYRISRSDLFSIDVLCLSGGDANVATAGINDLTMISSSDRAKLLHQSGTNKLDGLKNELIDTLNKLNIAPEVNPFSSQD